MTAKAIQAKWNKNVIILRIICKDEQGLELSQMAEYYGSLPH
jgi:hypothetical protein